MSHNARTQQHDCYLPKDQRDALVADMQLGCGNFLHKAVEANPNRDRTAIWLDAPFESITGERFESFSLAELKKVCDDYAAFYYGMGVREKDPVGIYVEEGITNYIHLIALTALGAIPVLVNGAMKPVDAAGYFKKVGVVAAFFGDEHARTIAPSFDAAGLKFVATRATAAASAPGSLPRVYPYAHVDDDVCIICHSSGTTGASKAVFEMHRQFFEGTRRRLGDAWLGDTDRVLSTLPHSHTAGITFFMVTILTGAPLLVLADYHARSTLPRIAEFRPTVVVGFTRTFVELASAEDIGQFDLRSVRKWVNVGDAAHEKHIRVLVQFGARVRGGETLAGAQFMDGFGSTEMAFSLFQKVFDKESTDYGRSLGRPHPIAQAAVIGDDGEILPANAVGRLGVKAPSVTRGYWNDSLLTTKTRVKGFWLTGDLVKRDAEGNYYHLDRITDAIRTRTGMVYTLPIEERLMQHHPDIVDASVLGVPVDDQHADAVGVVLLKQDSVLGSDALLRSINDELEVNELPRLARVVVARWNDPWPTGSTGKVVKRHLRERLLAARS